MLFISEIQWKLNIEFNFQHSDRFLQTATAATICNIQINLVKYLFGKMTVSSRSDPHVTILSLNKYLCLYNFCAQN